ncbi:MAG: hypothetical protein JST30_12265, partial [Armatimonadetes bacterium]|nr:hypothetical protein [Armatimonadota bacterium]
MNTFISALVLLAAQDSPAVPLFEGTGPHTRHVTSVPLAQKYFDQGLNMLYAFHHGEAKRSFRQAAKLDPECAMAWWGLAMANGPHMNNMSVPPEDEKEAYYALAKARATMADDRPVDQALVRAASVRFAQPQPADRNPLDKSFAVEMRKVWHRYPKDADAGALFAESMADLRPWNLWTADGTPYPGTPEIVETLAKVVKLQPDHPLALHLTIHALEMSRNPERALPAADRLLTLQPGLGHNVHMPSHIYVRTGDWAKAIDSNARAMRVDKDYRANHTPAPIYRMYMAHNNHMLSFAAMMIGQGQSAIDAVDQLVAAVPPDVQKAAAPFLDGFFAMPFEARVRFGKWDEVLASPELPDHFPLSRALRHAARAVAFAAKKMPAEAREEQRLFYMARRNPVLKGAGFGNNKASDILVVATHLMNGEILVAEGAVEGAVTHLRAGVKAEDALHYSEPPDWIQPVRHTLGALLLKEGRFKEAEDVYRA